MSPPLRVPPSPPTQESGSMDITLTLSPITPLDIQFNTPLPSIPSLPLFGHPFSWNLLEAHGSTCLCCIHNHRLIFGLSEELQYISESKRFGSTFSYGDAKIFNSFIHDTGLIDLPMGGRTLLSIDLKVVALDRLWSNHNPILLHYIVKEKWAAIFYLEQSKPLHTKLKDLKSHLKLWMQELKDLEKLESMDLDIKSAFLDFYKDKFSCQFVMTPRFPSLQCYWLIVLALLIGIFLESIVFMDETKAAVRFVVVKKLWGRMIKAGLASARTSILINGSPTLEFSLKRGLRQGDPLSHFLFIIVMEGLHMDINDGLAANMFHGIKVGSPRMHLYHLFYADDVIILSEWNLNSMENIIRILNIFYIASGLKINIHKSNVYGVGVSSNEVEIMAFYTGCEAGFYPFTYLSLPIRSNMSRITIGSLSLIVLRQDYRVPETVVKSLKSLRASVFWGSSEDSKKLA
ncbi:RNA-directed DNA polymerase, eukaryota, reverse transcriptase zinc-binding domain protein [Tanacetum coccineum]|uniref:RNA-directed DNA polymerase, eukaryota, reverse transcriptase zinc-binding domain protein n=1 Tax=Tanacetum coccineum TaxID=301880 RepID=A0ABQ5E7M9_9ASTR